MDWTEIIKPISIHALRYRVRCGIFHIYRDCFLRFQSTHSVTECDIRPTDRYWFAKTFQSTHSVTECDDIPDKEGIDFVEISIHALRYRVRCHVFDHRASEIGISIHALRYRVRLDSVQRFYEGVGISIHALRYRVRFSATTCGAYGVTISIHALRYRVRLPS